MGQGLWSGGHHAQGSVTPDTVFQAASIPKSASAWVVMHLVETGKLRLDTGISAYLTRWAFPQTRLFDVDSVTLRRILSHTAGLSVPRYPVVAFIA